MMPGHRFILPVLASLALAVPLTTLAAPPAGRLLAAQCAQCHGTDGKSVGGIDSLAGENAQELYNELLEMKYSTKTGDMMHRQAMGYNEQQLLLIAQYYAGLRAAQGTLTGTVAAGAEDEHDDDD